MDREQLFGLVTDEVYRDGVVEAEEHRILQTLVRFLRISSNAARALARESKQRYVAGALGEKRALSPAELYRSVIAAILEDGEVDDLEMKMSLGLRSILGIDEATHGSILAEVTGRGRPARGAPGPSPTETLEQLLGQVPSPGEATDLVGAVFAALDELLGGSDSRGDPEASLELIGRCLARSGDWPVDPPLVRARLLRCRVPFLIELGRPEEAVPALEEVLELLEQRIPQGLSLDEMSDMVDLVADLEALGAARRAPLEDYDMVAGAERSARMLERALNAQARRSDTLLFIEESSMVLASLAEIAGQRGDVGAVRRHLNRAESWIALDRDRVDPAVFDRLADIEVLYG